MHLHPFLDACPIAVLALKPSKQASKAPDAIARGAVRCLNRHPTMLACVTERGDGLRGFVGVVGVGVAHSFAFLHSSRGVAYLQ